MKTEDSMIHAWAAVRPRWLNVLACALVLACQAGLVSCRQHDYRTLKIDVPAMTNAVSERIVVNALCYELFHRRNDSSFHVDLATGIVGVTSDDRLKSSEFQARIEAALRDVGFSAKVTSVRPAPSDTWRERHVGLIGIAEMKSGKAANIAVAAIGNVLWPRQDTGVVVDLPAHSVTVKYDSLEISLKNLEHAIANAGLDANDVPANLGAPDALSHSW